LGYEIIVVGTSWGGLHALRKLVGVLPADFPVPVVLVQHRHKDSNHLLSSLLQERTALNVCEVEDPSLIEPGNVYVAPADYHLLVERGHFSLSCDEPVRYSRPSIDVTFNSAADAYGARAVGVVLTGANADGASGLRRIADRGGLALVQDPEGAESRMMPEAAARSVPEARVMPLPELAQYVATLPGHGATRQAGDR
jgi:two-component system, chemotaxis family, protein-glutamate methylesterase/glutaminase